MKVYLILLMMFVATFALPGAMYAQEIDAATIIMDRAEALNAGDAEAAAAFFAEDATYKINDPPPGARELYTGREEILGRLSDLVAINAGMEVEIQQIDGDNITTLTKFSDDPLRDMGIEFIEGIEKYTIQDGKITSYEWTMTEESGAKIAAAMATPATLPESGGNTFPTYTLVLALGGLAIFGGVGLALRRRRSTS